SILHALLLLKQTAESADRGLPLQVGGPHARHVDLGTVEGVVHRGNIATGLSLGIAWKEPARADWVELEASVGAPSGVLRTLALTYRQGDTAEYGMKWTG